MPTRARRHRLPAVLVAVLALLGGALTATPAFADDGVTVSVHVDALPGGGALQGASVSLGGYEAGYESSDETNAEGDVAFANVPADTYSLTVQRAGYVYQEWELDVADADVDHAFTLVPDDASVHGIVRDDNGDPVEGAWVAAYNETGGYSSTEDSTGADGAFRLDHLGEGDWTIETGFDGFGYFSEVVTLEAAQDLEYDIHLVALEYGTVQGTVRGSNGKPLKDINIDFLQDLGGGDLAGQYGGVTDAQGHFSAQVIPGSDFTIRAWALKGYSVPTYLGNVGAIDGATFFDVEADQLIQGKDIVMSTGGAIVAKVYKSTPDGKIQVNPDNWPGPAVWRKVGSDWVQWEIISPYAGETRGSVAVYGLPAGQYRVGFVSNDSPERAFTTQYWKGKSTFDSATTVTVKAGQTTTLSSTTIVYPKPDWDVEEPSEEEIEYADGLDTVVEADQGETFTIDVGEEYAGEWLAVTAHSDPQPMTEGWVRVDSKGRIKATVDYAVPPGEHQVIVQLADQVVLGVQSIEVAEDPTPAKFTTKPVPKLSGSVVVGGKVTAKTGTWKPTPASFSYRWLFNGEVIPDATGATYVPTVAQRGGKLSVEVTAARLGILDPNPVKLSKQSTIGLGTLKTATPKVTGTRKVGSVLTAVPGAWTEGTAFAFQWYRSGKAIKGATEDTYTQVGADAGKRITVKVKGSLEGYKAASKSSSSKPSSTKKGTLEKPVSIAVDGAPAVGAPLTVSYSGSFAPAPIKLSYKWYVGGKVVKGATKATFTPSASNVGKTVRVKVTASKSGYSTTSVTSPSSTAVVKGDFGTVPTPVITGGAVGTKAKVSTTGWSPKPSSFSYRWYLEGSDVAVSTSSTFTPRAADAGKELTVQVTAKRSGYNSASATATVGVTAAP